MNSLHGLLNCEIGGLDWHVITTEYRSVPCIHMYHLFRNELVYVIYSGVSGQYSHKMHLEAKEPYRLFMGVVFTS